MSHNKWLIIAISPVLVVQPAVAMNSVPFDLLLFGHLEMILQFRLVVAQSAYCMMTSPMCHRSLQEH